MVDIGVCLLLFFTLPLWAVLSSERRAIASQWWRVLTGAKTWIGYASGIQKSLPPVKPGVFTVTDGLSLTGHDISTISRLHFFYARDWEISRDMEVLWRILTGK
jgi:hypothetical protein